MHWKNLWVASCWRQKYFRIIFYASFYFFPLLNAIMWSQNLCSNWKYVQLNQQTWEGFFWRELFKSIVLAWKSFWRLSMHIFYKLTIYRSYLMCRLFLTAFLCVWLRCCCLLTISNRIRTSSGNLKATKFFVLIFLGSVFCSVWEDVSLKKKLLGFEPSY